MTSTAAAHTRPRVYVGPQDFPGLDPIVLRYADRVDDIDGADAVLWTNSDPASFPSRLPEAVRWVQLPAAGVERWIQSATIDTRRVWTSAAGAYAGPVAEHALAMLLAGVRGLLTVGRWRTWRRTEAFEQVNTLKGRTVAIVGAGAIGRLLVSQLATLECHALAVNRSGRPVSGATRTLSADRVDEALADADHVVLCAPATADTTHLINRRTLALLSPQSWIVNVGRGSLIDQDALIAAVTSGAIAGAVLDVTDPEPLPDDHPLWTVDRIVVTPHTANTPATLHAGLVDHLTANLHRWTAGESLLSVIDVENEY